MLKKPHSPFSIRYACRLASVLMLLAGSNAHAAAERHLVLDDCVVGGCANELCVEASAGPVASTCMYALHYACYPMLGECKRQPDGACGWTQTEALKACIANPPGMPGSKAPKTPQAPQPK